MTSAAIQVAGLTINHPLLFVAAIDTGALVSGVDSIARVSRCL